MGRGVTYFNYTSDQFSGFHGIVIPGTLRDSLYILDGLLEQETSLRPTEVMTDSASYSDQVRAVPASGLSVQPPPGRHRRRPVLAV